MGVEFNIDLGGGILEEPHLADVGQVLERATMAAAETIKGIWIARAIKLDIRRTGAYIAGIQKGEIRQVKKDIGDRVATITVEIVNTAPNAQLVEEGHAAFHLPSHIRWGNNEGRIKRTKDGKPFLHIPFRHRAHASAAKAETGGYTRATMAAMMPSHIHRQAKALHQTTKQNVGPIRGPAVGSRTGTQFVQADRYHWGGRLDRSHTRPAAPSAVPPQGGLEHRGERHIGRDSKGKPMTNPAWKSSKYHGMFKSTEGPGGSKHPAYMTIRTITPDSPGWNIPAQAGKHIARQVAHVVSQGRTGRNIMEQINQSILTSLTMGGDE